MKSYCFNAYNMPRLKFLDKTESFNVGIFCRNKSTEQSIYLENNGFLSWEKIEYAIKLRHTINNCFKWNSIILDNI